MDQIKTLMVGFCTLIIGAVPRHVNVLHVTNQLGISRSRLIDNPDTTLIAATSFKHANLSLCHYQMHQAKEK